MTISLRYIACVFVGMLFMTTARGQSCPSNLRVAAGESTVIDCALQQDFSAYQWTSMDPTWLYYLNDVMTSDPRFHAPDDIELPYYIAYRRLAFNSDGAVVDRELISITVYDPEESASSDQTQKEELADSEFIIPALPDKIHKGVPFLQCLPRITVNSGEIADISCTGLHSSEGLLAYRIESDWPPYSTTRVLGTGTFDYFVRAPVIHEPTSVHRMEIFAQVPGTEKEISTHVEVHVVNKALMFTCEDLVVDEAREVDLPCTVLSDPTVQLQLLSQPGEPLAKPPNSVIF